MELSQLSDLAVLFTFGLLFMMFIVPPLAFAWLSWIDRRQSQHAVLRNFPLLGRIARGAIAA